MQVAAFQCLQPLLGSVLAITLLGEEPSLWDLGAIGVIGGLAAGAVCCSAVRSKPDSQKLHQACLRELVSESTARLLFFQRVHGEQHQHTIVSCCLAA